MIRRSSYVAVLLLLTACSAAPGPASTYDQRQEGGVNVNVDLENFLILVARPSPSSASGLDLLGSLASLNAMAGLGAMRDLSRAAASAKESSEAKEQPDAEPQQPQQQPEAQPAQAEQGPVNESEKVVVVVQEAEKAGRSLEDIVRTLRNLKSKQPAKEEGRGAAGKYKFVDAVEEPQNLKLVGEGLENCGPGRSRDRLGICEGDAVSPE